VVAKSGQFRVDEMRKGQFLQGNQRNLAEKGVVKKDFVSKKSSEKIFGDTKFKNCVFIFSKLFN